MEDSAAGQNLGSQGEISTPVPERLIGKSKPDDSPINSESKPDDSPINSESKPDDSPINSESKPDGSPLVGQSKPDVTALMFNGIPVFFTPPAATTPPDSRLSPADSPEDEPVLSSFDIKGIAELIKSGRAKNIICMCGAGISVSAGIPDFRTPGTGLYSQLEKYKLPRPEAVFDISYFRHSPEAFFLLAKELFPGQYKPTPVHYFMKLLHDKGLLLRTFTQNIDSLETQAGLPKDAVIAAHGNFDGAHCIDCGREWPVAHIKSCIEEGKVCRCSCNSLVKPDIVFFGEQLPESFHYQRRVDFPKCDLLIVMGTSLVVHPFAGLIHDVPQDVPRLLINREIVGQVEEPWYRRMRPTTPESQKKRRNKDKGFQFKPDLNYRDALFLGDCDDGVQQLAELLGWGQDLRDLILGAESTTQGQQVTPTGGESVDGPLDGEGAEPGDDAGKVEAGDVVAEEVDIVEQMGKISLKD